jgi:hypothetical protein
MMESNVFFFVLSSLEHFSIIYSVAFSVRSVLTEKNRGFGPRQMHAIDIIHTTLDVSELSMSKTCFVQSCHACRAEWKKGDDIFHTTSVHYGAKFSNWFSKCIFLRLTHKDCSFNFQNLYHKKCLHLVLNVLLIKLTSSIKNALRSPWSQSNAYLMSLFRFQCMQWTGKWPSQPVEWPHSELMLHWWISITALLNIPRKATRSVNLLIIFDHKELIASTIHRG